MAEVERATRRAQAQVAGAALWFLEGRGEHEARHRCDAERVPAYQESSNPTNVPFYERQGFVARAPLTVPAGCPVITPMWREPR